MESQFIFISIAHESETMLNLPGKRNPSYGCDYVYGIHCAWGMYVYCMHMCAQVHVRVHVCRD